MKLAKKVFSEDVIGIGIMTMMITAALYIHTQSTFVQSVGLYLGLLIFIWLVGYSVICIFDIFKYIFKFLKSKSK